MGHLMGAFVVFLLAGFVVYMLENFGVVPVGLGWVLGAAALAAAVSLAISTRGFRALRPPPGSMPRSAPPS